MQRGHQVGDRQYPVDLGVVMAARYLTMECTQEFEKFTWHALQEVSFPSKSATT